MKKSALRFDFAFHSDRRLVSFARGVLSDLTGNAHFATPEPTLVVLQKAFDAFVEAIPSNNMRNSVNSAVKADRKAALVQLLRQLARYVSVTAGDNLEALQSSGFQLVSLPQPVGEMPAPTVIQVQPGNEAGDLVSTCNYQPGARLYEGRASQDGETWTSFAANTSGQLTFSNLPAEQKVWVQLRLKSSAGYGPWSQSVHGRVG